MSALAKALTRPITNHRTQGVGLTFRPLGVWSIVVRAERVVRAECVVRAEYVVCAEYVVRAECVVFAECVVRAECVWWTLVSRNAEKSTITQTRTRTRLCLL